MFLMWLIILIILIRFIYRSCWEKDGGRAREWEMEMLGKETLYYGGAFILVNISLTEYDC